MKIQSLGSLKRIDGRLPLLLGIAWVVWIAAPSYAQSAGETRLSELELQIWRSPEFQKRFTESFLAQTEIEPTVTQPEREKMLKVLELISADKLDEAARMLQKETKEGSSAVYDFTLGNIHFRKEQLEEAAAAYERAIKKYDKFLRAWKNLGLIYVRTAQFDKAIPALTRVIELGGGDKYTYGMLGFAYSSQDNHLCAESAFRQAILLDPGTLDWKMGLARSLFKQQCYAEAAAFCDNLIASDPNRAELWLLQANAYLGLNQPMKAAVNYELADRMGKSTADSLNMLGDIYVNQELFGMAVDSYIRALERDPARSTERAIRAAKVLAARGALDETKQLVERIEGLKGSDLSKADQRDLLMLRVRVAVAEHSGEEEIKMLEQLVALDPLDGESLILLGLYCARSGDAEKAVFYYERAESLEKYEADAKIRHAQLLVGQGKYAEALPLLRRAQDLKPREDVQKYLEQVERVAKTR
ncbi:MAG TPA: tetratricopeptide repeat protein [Sedimentisphaerales bacterium]|nr:tetratricopeptide repeat protein [Sedimentisphaerales bacterium]